MIINRDKYCIFLAIDINEPIFKMFIIEEIPAIFDEVSANELLIKLLILRLV